MNEYTKKLIENQIEMLENQARGFEAQIKHEEETLERSKNNFKLTLKEIKNLKEDLNKEE